MLVVGVCGVIILVGVLILLLFLFDGSVFLVCDLVIFLVVVVILVLLIGVSVVLLCLLKGLELFVDLGDCKVEDLVCKFVFKVVLVGVECMC